MACDVATSQLHVTRGEMSKAHAPCAVRRHVPLFDKRGLQVYTIFVLTLIGFVQYTGRDIAKAGG